MYEIEFFSVEMSLVNLLTCLLTVPDAPIATEIFCVFFEVLALLGLNFEWLVFAEFFFNLHDDILILGNSYVYDESYFLFFNKNYDILLVLGVIEVCTKC